MSNTSAEWSLEELKAYLLIYCAHADFDESAMEKELIQKKCPHVDVDRLHQEYDNDNDYASIEKIQGAIDRLGVENPSTLLDEVEELFYADGNFDRQEQNLFRSLRHVLKG